MFKKYLLSTVAVIAIINMSYAMELEDGEIPDQIFYVGPNKLPQGIRPGDVDVHLILGCQILIGQSIRPKDLQLSLIKEWVYLMIV